MRRGTGLFHFIFSSATTMNTTFEIAQEPTEELSSTASSRRGFLVATGSGVAALGMLSTIGSVAIAAEPHKEVSMITGTDNFYASDRVGVQKVTFKDQYRMNVAGNLFTPKNLDRSRKVAAIVVGHPMGAVKEQSANLYATKMAEQGFVTMSVDSALLG
jgi:hypothetical protein